MTNNERIKNMSIDLNNEHMGDVLIAAVRYALGRRTHIVGTVTSCMLNHVSGMTDRTIQVMERDIFEQERFGYGDECDKTDWMKLFHALTAEREKRKLNSLCVKWWREEATDDKLR